MKLSKTLFKIGMECPRQLYYAINKDQYSDSMVDDPFLKALAKGGFQVGALSNIYLTNKYKNIESHFIADRSEKALKRTDKLLKLENVLIFEAAVSFKNTIVRCDALLKQGETYTIFETKSKSLCHSYFVNIVDDENLWNEYKSQGRQNEYNGVLHKIKAFNHAQEFYVKKEFEEYVYDIAFQKWVVQNAFPNNEVYAYLIGPDKNATATVDGLNQKILIKESKGKIETIIRGETNVESLGDEILGTFDVNWLVDAILENRIFNIPNFTNFVNYLSNLCENNIKEEVKDVKSACKGCRFNNDLKQNGFKECMEEVTKESLKEETLSFKLWNSRNIENFINQDRNALYLKNLDFSYINDASSESLTREERQSLQVEYANTGSEKVFLRESGLRNEMNNFVFPLNFIDFETAMVAIPYRSGQSPYQMIAFQFSHHTLDENGIVKHENQYINLEPSVNPNFDFVRALKKALSANDGTIFMWSKHERTVLRLIAKELAYSEENDIDELITFIASLCEHGEREIIDMWDLYKRYMYLPKTNGSNSIKAVFPAVLDLFKDLERVLSNKNSYGKNKLFSSLNFEKVSWIQKDENGKIKDPYKLLPKVFKKYDRNELDLIFDSDEINNGGAAMVAYSVCQFTQISMGERERIKNALLRYCELDTFAMVIIFMYWMDSLSMFSEDMSFDDVVEKVYHG